MKKKGIIIFIAVSTIVVFLCFNGVSSFVKQVHNKSGMRVLENDRSTTSFIQDKEISNDISEAWHYMGQGDLMIKSSNFPKAIIAYKLAYAKQDYVGPLPGLRLIEAYESNGQFDEALVLLDELAGRYRFKENEYGLKKFEDIHTRLLAAKTQAKQKAQSQTP